MKRIINVVAGLLVAAVTAHVAPALASASSAEPQCGDEKKGGDTKGDKKDGDTKPKPPAAR
ncbi:MAG: hypothetical protein EOO73_03245 [Myxococcales bacterium]|nr:MAG: hypothetical protein EOO73_03245 [Myxococcales bacterium]